jgi:hypothetical protein
MLFVQLQQPEIAACAGALDTSEPGSALSTIEQKTTAGRAARCDQRHPLAVMARVWIRTAKVSRK